jgi:hypothetical protein
MSYGRATDNPPVRLEKTATPRLSPPFPACPHDAIRNTL